MLRNLKSAKLENRSFVYYYKSDIGTRNFIVVIHNITALLYDKKKKKTVSIMQVP